MNSKDGRGLLDTVQFGEQGQFMQLCREDWLHQAKVGWLGAAEQQYWAILCTQVPAAITFLPPEPECRCCDYPLTHSANNAGTNEAEASKREQQ